MSSKRRFNRTTRAGPSRGRERAKDFHEWHIGGVRVFLPGGIPREKHEPLLEAFRVHQANPKLHEITDKGMRQMGFDIRGLGKFIVSYDPRLNEAFVFRPER